jgi:hypothetical protein
VPRPANVIDPLEPTHNNDPSTFEERLAQLAEWQHPLLEHLECNSERSSRLHQILTSTEAPILLASDGGARSDLGSFGWQIAVGREVLWRCKGPTYGLTPGSFRAESYGFLSAVLFLYIYFLHYPIQNELQIHLDLYCDNQALLQRIARALSQSWHNPSACLASDYDLEIGIIDMLANIPVSIRLHHVKSHQDDQTAIHLLPWEAQMNVQADQLATDYLDNYADPSKLVPSIPASQASLSINGETINRRYAQRLRLASNGPALRQRIMLRNQWTYNTFRSINWEVPNSALDTMENSAQIFIIKFAHDHLPTRRHMHRIGKAETDKCPACQHIIETDWHILSCPRRSLWRESLIKQLKETLRMNYTQFDLTLILVQGVRGALRDPHFQMPIADREPRFPKPLSSHKTRLDGNIF